MNLDLFLKTLLFFAAVLWSLPLIYNYQRKEYLFYRVRSEIKESGFLKFFLSLVFKLPAKSLRNILIFFINLFLLSVYFYLVKDHSTLFSLLGIFISRFSVSLAVALSYPLTKLKEYLLISKTKQKIAKSKAVFIGITGSYGKSTTKEFLYEILKTRFNVAKTDANLNSETGICLSILKNLKPDTQYFIVEMGAYVPGDIHNKANIVNPKYGILTAIGNQHLDLFGSINNLVKTKGELLRALPKNGIAYVNEDTPYFEDLSKNVEAKITTFGRDSSKITLSADRKVFRYKNHQIKIDKEFLNPAILNNLAPCIALALDIGMNELEIEKAIKNIETKIIKIKTKKGLKSSTFLDDSYNSSLHGFLSAIETLNNLGSQDKLVITKGILELGKDKTNSYAKIIDLLKKYKLQLWTTDRDFRGVTIVKYFKDEDELLSSLKNKITEDYTVLVEGRFSPKFMKGLSLEKSKSE